MGKCINRGDMRHQVVIQQRSQSSDGAGGYYDTWSDAFTGWASIKPASQHERLVAMQMASPATHKIIMPYDSRIDTTKRIKFGERHFNIIEAINIEERGIYMQIRAVEGQAT